MLVGHQPNFELGMELEGLHRFRCREWTTRRITQRGQFLRCAEGVHVLLPTCPGDAAQQHRPILGRVEHVVFVPRQTHHRTVRRRSSLESPLPSPDLRSNDVNVVKTRG